MRGRHRWEVGWGCSLWAGLGWEGDGQSWVVVQWDGGDDGTDAGSQDSGGHGSHVAALGGQQQVRMVAGAGSAGIHRHV